MFRQHKINNANRHAGQLECGLLCAIVALLLPASAQTVRVDPNLDLNPRAGSQSSVATVALAVAQAQRWRKENPAAVIRIELAAGLHVLDRPLELDASISGTTGNPTILTSVPGQRAQLALAKKLQREDFQPLSDPTLLARLPEEARGKVRSLDLRKHGIAVATPADVHVKHETLELIVGEKRLLQSCWPNQGYAKMGEVLDRGMPPAEQGGTFRFSDARVLRWQNELNDGGVWLRGFWRVPWTRQVLRVNAINAQEQTIQFRRAITGGIGSKYGVAKRGQVGEESWQAINLLEEIDQPGEWAVNTVKQRLDVWLPDSQTEQSILLATRKEPLLRCRKVAHLRIEGLSFVAALGRHVEINDGEDVVVAGCEFRNCGDCAIGVTGGWRHQILANDIATAGREGIRCYGGERRTLKHSEHRLENNWIHDIGVHAPVAAVVIGEYTRAEAVGMFVRRNRIHDVPNSGIVFAGNDHLIEENEIYRIGLGSNDIGGIYTNSAWTGRGTVIRRNWIHHSPSANGIYMDDGSCGSDIEQNVIWHCATGVFIGGGHDQLVRGNIAIRCERALHVDSRGVSRNYTLSNPYYAKDLESVPHAAEPWSSRFPELLKLVQGETRRPQHVLLESNAAVACTQSLRLSGKEADFAGVQRGELVSLSDARAFEQAATMQLKIPRDVLAHVADFTAIDTTLWGLRRDGLRAKLPPRDLAELRLLDTFKPFTGNDSAEKNAQFDSQIDVDASNRLQSAAGGTKPQKKSAAPQREPSAKADAN